MCARRTFEMGFKTESRQVPAITVYWYDLCDRFQYVAHSSPSSEATVGSVGTISETARMSGLAKAYHEAPMMDGAATQKPRLLGEAVRRGAGRGEAGRGGASHLS